MHPWFNCPSLPSPRQQMSVLSPVVLDTVQPLRHRGHFTKVLKFRGSTLMSSVNTSGINQPYFFLGTFPHSQVPHSCVWSCSLSSVTFREAAWRNRAWDLVLFCRRWNMMDVCGLLLFPIQLYFWVNLSCRLSRPCNANRQALFSTPPPSFGSSWTAAHLSLMLPLVRFYPECCSLLQYHSSGSVHMVFMSFTAYLSTALSPLAGYI